jgi:acetylornithine/N-succinyldiaminopimelate aminotransferase
MDTNTLSHNLIMAGQACFTPNYQPQGIVLERGLGAQVWDLEGRAYIDFGAGIAVSALGHQDPDLVAALQAQLHKLWHTSNLYYTEPAIRLAAELVQVSFAERVFFCNSGAEANEAAIKLARRYASEHLAPEQRQIVTFHGGFHGRTLATVTATAQPKYHSGFEPLPGGFRYCAFNDFVAAERAIDSQTCAVLVEPIQGEGGIIPAQPGFLQHLRACCDRVGALLIVDEIQSGMGRTGRLFAHQWESGLTPDVMSLAKGLGSGMPIGAMLVGSKAAEILQLGSHGSTFGGNPLACAVARAVLRKVNDPHMLKHIRYQGEQLRHALDTINAELGVFETIRGQGLMLGAQLAETYHGQIARLLEYCRHQGVLVLQAGTDVVRLVPPLTINSSELTLGIERLDQALRVFAVETR